MSLVVRAHGDSLGVWTNNPPNWCPNLDLRTWCFTPSQPVRLYQGDGPWEHRSEFKSCVRVLMSLMVSVDVKQHWSQFVSNMSTRHPRTLSSISSGASDIMRKQFIPVDKADRRFLHSVPPVLMLKKKNTKNNTLSPLPIQTHNIPTPTSSHSHDSRTPVCSSLYHVSNGRFVTLN